MPRDDKAVVATLGIASFNFCAEPYVSVVCYTSLLTSLSAIRSSR